MDAPRDLLHRVLDELVIRSVAAAESGSVVLPAPVLRLLLARYAATGRADVEAALGPALGAWLEGVEAERAERAGPSAADDLRLSLDATLLSPDARIPTLSASLVRTICADWMARSQGTSVGTAMCRIEACLRASDREEDTTLLASAIDELERVIAAAYRPGDGIAVRPGSTERGGLSDHVCAASTLLAAYERTGRLPYSMLAEELVQAAGPSMADADDSTEFVTLCRTIDVLYRLALLHDDPEYRSAAVIKAEADYAGDARRLAERLSGVCLAQDLENSAEYGLALSEWLDLQ